MDEDGKLPTAKSTDIQVVTNLRAFERCPTNLSMDPPPCFRTWPHIAAQKERTGRSLPFQSRILNSAATPLIHRNLVPPSQRYAPEPANEPSDNDTSQANLLRGTNNGMCCYSFVTKCSISYVRAGNNARTSPVEFPF